MRNDGGNANHWISILARGRESNRSGIGAKVRLTARSATQLREINPSGSYLSTSDVRLHFGLGASNGIERLEIEWPSGKNQVLANPPVDRPILLDETAAGK
jgi:hypothetical protein